jgi:hypothetical protein
MLGDAIIKDLWNPLVEHWENRVDGGLNIYFKSPDADEDIPEQRRVYTKDQIRKVWDTSETYYTIAAMHLDSGTVFFTNVSEFQALCIAAAFVRIWSTGLDRTVYDAKQKVLAIFVGLRIDTDPVIKWEAHVVSNIPKLLLHRPKDVPLFADE